jgi:hypothetical protein
LINICNANPKCKAIIDCAVAKDCRTTIECLQASACQDKILGPGVSAADVQTATNVATCQADTNNCGTICARTNSEGGAGTGGTDAGSDSSAGTGGTDAGGT